jgi:hypothetical protein
VRFLAWISTRVPLGPAAALGSSVLLLFAACPAAKPPPAAPAELRSGGVQVRRIAAAELERKPWQTASEGDWLIASDRVKVVVGAPRETAESKRSAGALLDLTAVGAPHDRLDRLEIGLRLAGVERGIVFATMAPVMFGERPALRIIQREAVQELELETSIVPVAGEPRLELVTRVVNRGRVAVSSIRVADYLSVLGDPPFLPRTLDPEPDERVDWLAYDGKSVTYGLVREGGPLEVELGTARRGFREQVALSPEFALPPGSSFEHRRSLIVSSGGLPAVAEVAWPIAGRPVGTVEGRLTPLPSWARLEVLGARGELLLKSVISAGRFRLALPAGSYRVRVLTPGGADEQALTVAPGAAPLHVAFVAAEPRRLVYRVVDASSGDPLPARVLVRGIAPTPDPNLGPWHVAAGAANVAYTASGDGALELPPGRYRVLVSHGLEWSTFEQQVDVSSERGVVLRARLLRAFETENWLACDFHLHADPSGDSEVPLRDRVIALLAEGVEFAVATDHNHVTDYGPSIAELGAANRLGAARGVEITTGSWGHFNAFPMPAGAQPPEVNGVAPAQIFAAVRRTVPGSVIQINHPRMGPDIGYFTQGQLDVVRGAAAREGFSLDFDAIELHNGFEHGDPAVVERNLADWFALLEAGWRFTGVGNSDSHHLVMQWAGYPRTYVRTSADRPGAVSADSVARSVRLGRAIVTSGPFIELRVNDGEPGDHVTIEGGRVRVEITVRAAEWVDVRRVRLIGNGRTLLELDASAGRDQVSRLTYAGELKLDRDTWLIATATGEQPSDAVLPGWRSPPRAFTNPVWVDVDGDGLVTRSPR